ncbi:thioesterase family protein [Ruixingdingia sedimenti]|uniref:Thioesterase family protein n=1 Tax=Ruixingdingia sedimenti TaxID=3073604 RepID=A0ABU1F796_9RHOB|nr:thioesterase family protein [Xinfangfangia sp. LG-4]MDR5652752.1 thioesterase family protein [Xinfangfangia sp. LG-4]
MYPFFRFAAAVARARRAPRIGLFEATASDHWCLPWDLDPWVELNNGRTLTLYDLGRIPFAVRVGFHEAMQANRWGLTVAGVSVRYRRRVRAMEKFSIVTRMHGWDDRFIYIDQSIWKGAECANQMLLRWALTGKGGIVHPARLIEAVAGPQDSPPLPGWVAAWIAADAERPWPPEPGPGAGAPGVAQRRPG